MKYLKTYEGLMKTIANVLTNDKLIKIINNLTGKNKLNKFFQNYLINFFKQHKLSSLDINPILYKKEYIIYENNKLYIIDNIDNVNKKSSIDDMYSKYEQTIILTFLNDLTEENIIEMKLKKDIDKYNI